MIAAAALGMVQNAALLLSLGVLYFLAPSQDVGGSRLRDLLTGAVIGVIGIALMMTNWELVPGLYFDTRSVLLVLAGLYFGPVPSGAALLVTGAYRAWLGGLGTAMGVGVIVSSAALGVLWRIYRPGRTGWGDLYLLGLVTHLVMLAWAFTMPLDAALVTLRQVSMPVLVIHPVATMLLGRLLALQRERLATAEDAERNSRRLEGMLRNAWGILSLVDSDRRITFASPPVREILGYRPDQVVGRRFEDLIHPEDLPQLMESFRALLGELGGSERQEARFRHAEGHWVWVEHVATNLLKDPDVGAVVVNTRDITEARRAARALAESEEVHRTLIEGLPDFVLRFDREGRHLFASPNVEELTGIPAPEFIGKTHSELGFPPDLCRVWEAEIQAVVTSGRPRETEFRLPVLGREVLLDWRLLPEVDGNGKVRSVFSISRDITEQRRAEEALRREKERLANVMEGTGVGTWEWNIQSGETVFDDRWAAMVGYTVEELQPGTVETWENLVHPQDLATANEELRRHLSGEREAYVVEYRMLHKDGHEVWVLDRGKIIERTAEGLPLRMFGTHTDITARKVAEGERQLLAKLVEHARNEIYVFSEDTLRFTRVSWGALENLGYSQEEMRNLTPMDLKPEYGESEFRALLEPVLSGERDSLQFETHHRRKDGSSYPVETHLSHHPEDGLFLAVAMDVTDRKRAEAELIEREEHQRSLLTSAPMAIFTLDRAGKVLSWNPAAEAIFGWTAGEAVGRRLPIVPRHAQEELDTLLAGVVRGEIIRQKELTRIRKDGSEVLVALSAAPIRTAEGEVEAVMSVLMDVTEQRKAERALLEERILLRRVMETSPVGIVLLDPNGAVLFLNRFAEETLGLSLEEAEGRRYDDLGWTISTLDGGDHGYGDRVVAQVLGSGSPVSDVLIAIESEGGHRILVSVSAAAVRDPQGEDRGMVAIFEDVTQRVADQERRRQVEEELLQAQKLEAVARLAGGVAHDFNNMLAVIMSAAEMAIPQADPKSTLYQDLMHIHEAAQRSAGLTRQLLAFSRKQIRRPRSLDLNEIITGQEKMLRRLLGEDLSIVLDLGKDLWPVNMDPSQVDQILANLMVNARDAIPGVGTVTVKTENVDMEAAPAGENRPLREGRFVALVVGDTGSGMDAETMDRIFEPFFTTKAQGRGTGLGLSTVYGIVQQSGGVIQVSSAPGEGTTFRIYLPRAEGEEEEGEHRMSESSQGEETILIVEDEASILQLARRFLEERGYRVLTAGTPMEALGLVHEADEPIHLLLTDVVMPGMNGRQLQSRVKEILPDIRTLFMSGYTAEVIAQRGVVEEDVDFVQKPFSMPVLARRVREVLDAG